MEPTKETGSSRPMICSLNNLEVLIPDDIRDHIAKQYRDGESRVNEILQAMKTPPSSTICRVNLIQGTRDEIRGELEKELHHLQLDVSFSVEPYSALTDVLCVNWRNDATKQGRIDLEKPVEGPDDECLFPSWPSRKSAGWPMNYRACIVDRFCGEAVLRGSNIFVKGIMCADRGIQEGETIAVYADVRPTIRKAQKLKRGSFMEDYRNRLCVYLGLGVAKFKRSDFFRLEKGVGIQMLLTGKARVGPMLPPISGILPSKIFFQNLPSIVVAHALAPRAGDVIIDMCAAPGGKTSHIASLLRNDATIVACDKSRKKMLAAQAMFREMGATCITTLALDSTDCVLGVGGGSSQQSVQEILQSATKAEDGLLDVKAFPPESFDRILLDPPCSALGLRPKLQIVHVTLKELQQASLYQRKFVRQAEALLKPGGTMTYSTCTFIGDENERMVRFILDQFPSLELVPVLCDATISIGSSGLEGLGLDEKERGYVRRFDPLPTQGDTIGFFVAKFQKRVAL